ncbi:hypothetical protein HRI_004569000 [Hibiscus trionum]|uniref:Uncharacterized protein n=1 Tax=Hibiscus trionum TaxID=183268 RepID=A0A9W7J9W9_HIBTR|nr:hypothetical protein HRI_004569000 [Hibiscus trionum]
MSVYSFSTGKSLTLLSNFVLFCSFIAAHPLYLSYFIIVSPYFFKILSFFSPLFITATLWLLAFLTLTPTFIKHAGENLPESMIGFLLTTYQTLVETLRYKVDDYDQDNGGFEYLEELEAPVGNKGPLRVPENEKPEEITRTETNQVKAAVGNDRKVMGADNAAEAIVVDGSNYNEQTMGSDVCNFGSTRKQKEWERTLACKLFEERHSYNVDGGGGGNHSYDEQELSGQFCCLQTLKLSDWKKNLGMGRPKLNFVKKTSTGLGWLRRICTRYGKKGYH